MNQLALNLNWRECKPLACPVKIRAQRRSFGKKPVQLTLQLFVKMTVKLWTKTTLQTHTYKSNWEKASVSSVKTVEKMLNTLEKAWTCTKIRFAKIAKALSRFTTTMIRLKK